MSKTHSNDAICFNKDRFKRWKLQTTSFLKLHKAMTDMYIIQLPETTFVFKKFLNAHAHNFLPSKPSLRDFGSYLLRSSSSLRLCHFYKMNNRRPASNWDAVFLDTKVQPSFNKFYLAFMYTIIYPFNKFSIATSTNSSEASFSVYMSEEGFGFISKWESLLWATAH